MVEPVPGRAWRGLGTLNGAGAKAGPFDGLMEAKKMHWQDLVARGLSPTALGTYAQCPMRYWMTHVLKVGGTQDPMSKELPGRVWGELVHKGLCEVYQDLSKYGMASTDCKPWAACWHRQLTDRTCV